MAGMKTSVDPNTEKAIILYKVSILCRHHTHIHIYCLHLHNLETFMVYQYDTVLSDIFMSHVEKEPNTAQM